MSLALTKALLVLNAKAAKGIKNPKVKGWTDEARKKAALTRKAKSKVSAAKAPKKAAASGANFKGNSAKQTKDALMWSKFAGQKHDAGNVSRAVKAHAQAMAFHKAKGNKEGVAFHKKQKDAHAAELSKLKGGSTGGASSTASSAMTDKVKKNLDKYTEAFKNEGWDKLAGSKSSIAKQVDEMWDSAGRATNPKSMTKENKEYRKALIEGLHAHYNSKK